MAHNQLRKSFLSSEVVKQEDLLKKIEDLKLEKIKAVEETKKEADKIMIKKIIMYENKLIKQKEWVIFLGIYK